MLMTTNYHQENVERAKLAMVPVAPLVVSRREEDSMNNEPSLSGRQIIGIIYPPPDIRTIVDKTAGFVARNGIEFENKIREKEAGNVRFNFLSATDPYNAYYQHKVREFQEGTAIEPSIQRPQLPTAIQEAVKRAEFVPREPPPEYEFSADSATINAFDLDLIKLTALFVARNGRQFLTQLMNREIRNYQFDFLKPQHSNYSYFTKLVEQYTKVIIPPKSMIADLNNEIVNPKKFLDTVNYRVEWERHQRRIKEREEAEAEKERLAYAQIDWHDFVVVQTVDFQQHETANLPPLCTPKDVGTRILLQARQEAAKAATQTVEMDMESDSGDEDETTIENETDEATTAAADRQHQKHAVSRSAYEVTQPMPAAPLPQNVLVREYDPKKARAIDPSSKKSEKWLISPLTGERIPADKLEEHVRFNTVDSQYFVQREREQMEKADEEPVYAHGSDIGRNIQQFAERRTDIFGVGAKGAEQTVIGKKMGEEEIRGPDPKTIWDGQQSSIEMTTKAAQQSITIDQQIAEIHKAQGFIPTSEKEKIGPPSSAPQPSTIPPPPPPVIRPPIVVPIATPTPMPPPVMLAMRAPPMFLGAPTPMPPHHHGFPHMPPMQSMSMGRMPMRQDMIGGQPPAKRARTEEDLEPEDLWLSKVHGTINMQLQTPNGSDRPEWKCDGSIMKLSIDIKESVASLKTKIQDITGVPVAKQKLLHEGIFLKDNASLAFYNMSNASTIILQLKERGGRKK